MDDLFALNECLHFLFPRGRVVVNRKTIDPIRLCLRKDYLTEMFLHPAVERVDLGIASENIPVSHLRE